MKKYQGIFSHSDDRSEMRSLSVWKEWAHESVLSVEAREGVALPEMQLEAAGSLPVWMGSGNWPPDLYKSNARS